MIRASLLALLLVTAGCRTSLDPDIDPNKDGGGFHCASDAECGGGWHCNLSCNRVDFTPYCLPDSECDACPDLLNDPHHCGSCATACAPTQACVNAMCLDAG